MKFYISTLTALQAFADRERGAAMPEYGLLVALIAVAAMGTVLTLGTNLSTRFGEIATAIGN